MKVNICNSCKTETPAPATTCSDCTKNPKPISIWVALAIGFLSFFVFVKVFKGFSDQANIIIAFILVLTPFFVIKNINGTREFKKNYREFWSKVEGFTVSQILYNGLALDEGRGIICFFDPLNLTIKPTLVTYQNLLSCEIIEDGNSITKTSRLSQLGGAAVGGLLLGGLGAIVGGLSGSKTTSREIDHITLSIIINDTENPVRTIKFLEGKIKRNSIEHTDLLKKAKHWHSIIEILIKKADTEDKVTEQNELKSAILGTKNSALSLADELSKLVSLRDSGILTNEEFTQQKTKLLSS